MSLHRKFASLAAALILTLSLTGTAFAGSATSDTSESLTVASTVSMTAQASATYTLGDRDGDGTQDFGTGVVVTVLSSNNPSGVTLTAQVDPFTTGGGITVPTTKRWTAITELDCASAGQTVSGFLCPTSPAPQAASGSPLVKSASQYARGAFASSSTVKSIAASTGALANADIGVEFAVNATEFPVGGTYTSAVHWATSTNP